MECRYITLQKIIDAIGKINIPLVGFDGSKFTPFLTFDDVGLYIFVPKIVQFFHVSLQQAIDIFFYSQIAVSFALGLIGFLLLSKNMPTRIVSLISWCVFLRLIFYQLYDVYCEYLVSFLSIIPLFLYFCLKNSDSKFFNYFLMFAGMIIGFSHYVRTYSALPVLGFIMCMVVLHENIALMKKVVLIASLFLGIFVAGCYFENVIRVYKNFAQTNFKEFDSLQTKHVFWHQVYIGFGFLKFNNKDDVRWDDAFGDYKVRQINPEVSIAQTNSYETILKNEVFKLIKTQLHFVIWTIFAKLGILLFYLLFFANFGLLAFYYSARRYDLIIAFLCTFGLSSITPLLTLPTQQYALSFICCAFIFGLFYVQQCLDNMSLNAIAKINGYMYYIVRRKYT